MEDGRSPGVKIPNTAHGLPGATSLFKRVGYSPGENLSMDPTYLPNQIASQRTMGPGLTSNPSMMPSLLNDMQTSGLPSMSLSPESVVVAGVGEIPPSMALAPPKKAVTKKAVTKNKNKKKKGKKGKKGEKKKGGYKKRRSTTRRSKKRRSTTRRSKKPTLKRRTQRKKNKV